MPVSPRAMTILGVALLLLLSTCGGPRLFAPAAQSAAGPQLAGMLIAPPRVFATPAPTQQARPSSTAAPLLGGLAAPVRVAAAAVAQDPQTALLDSYLNDLANAGLFQGSVLVAHNGQLLLSKGYGTADGAQADGAQTRFRLASLTKQFTAAAILLLQARGALDLGDPICRYLDPCPAHWQPITIRQLLNHTSGLPNYTDFADFDATSMQPTSPQDLVARFRDVPLTAEPGTRYNYNNSGYVLLGLIIERVSGQPYEAFLQQTIFEPLGMHDSGVDHNAGTISAGAVGYTAIGQPADFLDTSTLFACGSLYATVDDMYRWDQALYSDTPLAQAQRDAMFTPGLGSYGYGWKITNPGGHRLISHQGNLSGFSNFIARYPDDHLTVIVLSNLESADAPGIAAYIANLVFNS